MTWEPPKRFYKGIVVPEEVRVRMKEGDKLDLLAKDGRADWLINDDIVFSGTIQHPPVTS